MANDQNTPSKTLRNSKAPKGKGKGSESSGSTNLMNTQELNKDKNNLSTILHTGLEQTTQNHQIAYVGNNLTINKPILSEHKKHKETEGKRAMLGSAFGVVLGIIAGLSTGFLAIFTIPIFATIGYLSGMYIADKVEAGLKTLSDNNFSTKIKNFFTDRGERLDRTLGGIVGIIVGIALAATTGPAFLIALPFAVFFGNRIGAELGQNISPIVINGIRKVWAVYQETFQAKHSLKINRIEAAHDKFKPWKKLDDSENQD